MLLFGHYGRNTAIKLLEINHWWLKGKVEVYLFVSRSMNLRDWTYGVVKMVFFSLWMDPYLLSLFGSLLLWSGTLF